MNKVCLVVPTIRESVFKDFYHRWNDLGLFDVVDLMIMEDNPLPTFDMNDARITHLSWKDIDAQEHIKNIIPRRSDTVRSFGYLEAFNMGYEYIMTLDDDCYPPSLERDGVEYKHASELVRGHLQALDFKSKWFNTLDGVKPRGIPFYNLGHRSNVVINHGLWTNVLDYDAPTQLVAPNPVPYSNSNQIVPHGSYFPMCGMNVMWKSGYTVLMYHLLMGRVRRTMRSQASGEFGAPSRDYGLESKQSRLLGILEILPFDRFGDIWCGIFAKKICDIAGLSISTGTPYIRHERASNPFANLKKEARGLEVNEKLWEYVDKFEPDFVESRSVVTFYALLGDHIAAYNEFPEYERYFKELGEAMNIWAGEFE